MHIDLAKLNSFPSIGFPTYNKDPVHCLMSVRSCLAPRVAAKTWSENPHL